MNKSSKYEYRRRLNGDSVNKMMAQMMGTGFSVWRAVRPFRRDCRCSHIGHGRGSIGRQNCGYRLECRREDQINIHAIGMVLNDGFEAFQNDKSFYFIQTVLNKPRSRIPWQQIWENDRLFVWILDYKKVVRVRSSAPTRPSGATYRCNVTYAHKCRRQ